MKTSMQTTSSPKVTTGFSSCVSSIFSSIEPKNAMAVITEPSKSSESFPQSTSVSMILEILVKGTYSLG